MTTAQQIADRIPADLVRKMLPTFEHGGAPSVRGAIRHERAALRLDRMAGDVGRREARDLTDGLRDLAALVDQPDALDALRARADRDDLR